MLDVNPSGAENTQAIDEVIFHSLATDLVAGARYEGSDRDVIFTIVIGAVEMKGDRFSSFIVCVQMMLTKSVCYSSASFPNISLGTAFTNEGLFVKDASGLISGEPAED
ncbi:hypothetical protein BsWGS_01975 [Bradybaena similaris]